MSGIASLIARLKLRLPSSGRQDKPEPYVTEWKHYYQILRVDPEADTGAISAAYRRLIHVYHNLLSLKTQETPFFTQRIADTEEAYRVLSDEKHRAAYDHVLWGKAIACEAPVADEFDRLVTLIVSQMTNSDVTRWRLPPWGRAIGRLALMTNLVIVLVTSAGTSLALARPEAAAAAPFRGIAATFAETSAGAISLIEEVRAVTASYEHSVVSTAVQSMRITERLVTMPAVGAPTNDMASFPSKEHSLFPEYLDRRFSQFKYTVDSQGIVQADTSGAITDALLAKIKELLRRLEAE